MVLENYDDLEVGDLIFVRGDTIISKIINRVDKGEFSHLAIYVGNGKVLEAQRFTKTRITDYYFKNIHVYKMNLSPDQKCNLLHLVPKFVGIRYDYLQVFQIAMKKLFNVKPKPNNRDNFICSELVVNLYSELKIFDDDFKLLALDSTPNELYNFLLEKFESTIL